MRILSFIILLIISGTLKSQGFTNFSFSTQKALKKAMLEDKNIHLLIEGDVEIIKLNISSIGGKFKYASGNICAVNIPSSKISELNSISRSMGIKRIGYNPTKGNALNDLMVINNNIDSIHKGLGGLLQAYDGAGVILGFIDTGVDFSHPDFKNANGSTRILYIWDQRDPFSPKSPQPYDYGTEWTSSDINAGSCTHDDPSLYNGHGSHVVGIGAGNGNAVNNFAGVAPKANIIVVSSDFEVSNWTETVADAINYIFTKADSLNMPCVINTSIGTLDGSRDAKDLPAKLIENMIVEKNGRVVVAAAGNSGNTKFHLGYNVNADTSFTWIKYNSSLSVPDFAPSGGVFFELYADSSDFNNVYMSIGVDKISPNYQKRGNTNFFTVQNRLNTIVTDTIKNSVGNRLAVVHTWVEINDGTYMAQVIINPDSITNYDYRFSTTGNGRFDLWSSKSLMGTSDIQTNIPSVLTFPDIVNYKLPDSLKTIVSSWTCSPKVISVGNYINKDSYVDFNGNLQSLPDVPGSIRASSSVGPNRIGVLKPEIAATGCNIFSAGRIATLLNWQTSNPTILAYGGMHYRTCGTSLASPVVAGIAALYLQKCPNASWSEVRNAILSTAFPDNYTGTVPNYTWGNGKVNGLAALSTSDYTVQITNNGNTSICQLDSVILSAPTGYNEYVWNTGENVYFKKVGVSGSYYVFVTNSSGCEAKSQTIQMTVYPNPEKPTVIRNGNVLLSSPSNFYQWYKDNNAINGAQSQVYMVSQEGSYFVEVLNNYFCSNRSDTVNIIQVSIDKLKKDQKLVCFPNPTVDYIYVDLNDNILNMNSFFIVNSIGQKIVEELIYPKQKMLEISLEFMPAGIYYLTMSNEMNKAVEIKIVKK